MMPKYHILWESNRDHVKVRKPNHQNGIITLNYISQVHYLLNELELDYYGVLDNHGVPDYHRVLDYYCKIRQLWIFLLENFLL